MKRFTILASLALALLAVVGCTNWERTAYQTLAASKATINQAQADYEVGTSIPHNASAYKAINTAKDVQTVAVNALVTYESLKANNGTTDALAKAQADVATALGQLPTIIQSVKALYTEVK